MTVPFQTTLLVRDSCLCLHVQRAARALSRRFDDALKPVGLTNEQFSLLMSLNRPVPARMRDVAELLAVDRTTLTAAVKVLQRRGLLHSAVDPSDRRGRLLTLTAAGRKALAAAAPVWKRHHRAVEKLLGGDAGKMRENLKALQRAG